MNKKIILSSKLLLLSLVAVIGLSAFTLNNNDRLYDIAKNIEIFVNVFKEINAEYVDEIDPNKLMKTGIDAMLGSLDPYTNYISESQIESYRLNSEGKYKGIGAIVKKIDDYVTIVELYDNSPVLEAGLNVGDQIIAVDGKSTLGKSIDDVNQIMRGVPGTAVNVTIKSAKDGTERTLDLLRSDVSVPNVPYSGFVEDGIAYVALTTFTPAASQNVANALQKLKEEVELEGVILDLRDNGGGLLAEAIGLCNVFVAKGTHIVSTKGKIKERDKNFKTLKDPLDLDVPLAVMINKSSASASEIVSGVMQDLDRGIIIGQRSYGKGLVQNTRNVGYNSKVKLTTSKYYIPSGRCIQSVEYENGEPKDIPDSKRAKFKTQNGREVLDGGGVAPDVYTDAPENNLIMNQLVKNNVIFKYVNTYLKQKPAPDSLETIEFVDFSDFVQYIESNKFDFGTNSEKKLVKLREEAEEEGLLKLIGSDIEMIEDKINQERIRAIEKNKELIVSKIEQEIATRYFYQKGKAHQRLDNDPEIQKAILILKDQNQYNSILKS